MTLSSARTYELKQSDVQLQPFISQDLGHPLEINERRRERQKWRTTLFSFVILACAVLVINTGFLAWTVRTRGTTDGVGVLYEASCEATKRANIGVHLVINILSSALLGASNYCMQCLSAPTRSEVDKAHNTGNWLDIGIPSLRNVVSSSFGTRKKVCWWILAISSLPLHLCYNSVVFMSLSAQTYAAIQFGPEAKAAIENGTFDGSPNITSIGYMGTYNASLNGQLYSRALKSGRLQELTLLECIDLYSTTFQSTRGNVFLVVDEGVMNTTDAYGTFPSIYRSGTCSTETGTKWVYQQFGAEAGGCFAQEGYRFLPRLRADPSMWSPFLGLQVKKCLSESVGQQCKLNFSVPLAIVVIIFNAIKALTVLVGICQLRNDPMLTVGDAVVSFLQTPEPSSLNMCLASQADVHRSKLQWQELQQPRAYTNEWRSWSSSVKKGKRRMVWLALFAAIAVLFGLFIFGYSSIQGQKDLNSILRMGLQSVDPRTIVQSDLASHGLSGILENVIIANTPQVIISLVYFSYNAAITSMLLAYEWSGFFGRAKSLRVSSSRQGLQRSTYFLQLPYRYALPLLGFSALLHWLASQSLSVVSVELYNMFGEHDPSGECTQRSPRYPQLNSYGNYYYSCGSDFITMSYSPLGILLSLIVAVILTISIFTLGRKKLSPAPVVGSCSVAIAASCHARPDEQVPWEKRLKWGAFTTQSDIQYFGMAHCGLSSREVEEPVVGTLYT